ncbi:MAG TPA: CapA family protein [Solirubrobacterales bacterium]|nr:CapA family protein [Solirubrobacterales bacterium]
MSPSIALLGDVMLGRGVAERIARGRPEDVWSAEVRELLRSCDLVLLNLECCVSERGAATERIPGKPFFFRAPPAAVESLRAIGARAVGLANNHALDYESPALLDTLALLDAAGIARCGAGRDEPEARRPTIADAQGKQVGMVAVSDHPREFAAAPGAPGTAHADLRRGVPDWLASEVERLRARCDRVVAFLHWGPNMTTEPAGWQLAAAEEMQRAGADLVAGHSAHVFHGVGWSERGPLLFDLGDALDDYAVDRALRNDLGVAAIWRPGEPEAELELVGLELDFCHTRLAEGEAAEWIARRLALACAPLGTRVERAAEQRFRVEPA